MSLEENRVQQKLSFSFVQVICIAFLLGACAGKAPLKGAVADMGRFPQDLQFYAQMAGPDRPLLTAEEQREQYARFQQRYFAPWRMKKTSIKKRDISPLFGKARGYRLNAVRWTQKEWEQMGRNADLAAFPNRAQHAITLRNTDLREMPTHLPRFTEPVSRPADNPFDYFQYSRLPVGTPLLIAHISRDGRWYFVECAVAAGWVDAQDVAPADSGFQAIWQSGAFAALVRDGILMSSAGSEEKLQGHIGAVLPLRGQDEQGFWRVLLPARAIDGMARAVESRIAMTDAAPQPIPMTARRVAELGNIMMGQPYGWGGMLDRRDCSALTRDLMAPFGVWLPRNSSAQARQGTVVRLEGMSVSQKEDAILKQGVPFLSLVGMRGHITLYVGAYDGRPALYHNVWGVRVIDGADDNARFVIGRTVVTSVTPGVELRNLYRSTTFADRLLTLTTPR
ncbi:MAG: SH3 domain-containing protein [Desulfovibrio sp.]|nr:SH3 domain-containing protein [Desulfovibrio sp.]